MAKRESCGPKGLLVAPRFARKVLPGLKSLLLPKGVNCQKGLSAKRGLLSMSSHWANEIVAPKGGDAANTVI